VIVPRGCARAAVFSLLPGLQSVRERMPVAVVGVVARLRPTDSALGQASDARSSFWPITRLQS